MSEWKIPFYTTERGRGRKREQVSGIITFKSNIEQNVAELFKRRNGRGRKHLAQYCFLGELAKEPPNKWFF